MNMEESEIFEQLDKEFKNRVESHTTNSLVPYDCIAAYKLVPELETILKTVIPGIVVESNDT